MPVKTRAQNYSKNIYSQFLAIKGLSEKEKNRYGALCHQFPVMVLQNGLMQAVGYLLGKGQNDSQKPETILLNHFAEQFNCANAEAFHTVLQNSEITKYQYYTRQLLEMAVWYKRYAESVLDVQSAGEEQ